MTYEELLEHYINCKDFILNNDQIAKLVGTFLFEQSDNGETAIKDITIDYYLNIIAVMQEKISAIEFKERLIKPIIDAYKDRVIKDHNTRVHRDDEYDGEEEKEAAFW